jgi:hypothetical protein
MHWETTDGPEGPIFHIGARVVIGWSKPRQVYWMQLMCSDGETVEHIINLPDTTDELRDVDDLADAASLFRVFKGADDDPEIDEWTDNEVVRSHLESARFV